MARHGSHPVEKLLTYVSSGGKVSPAELDGVAKAAVAGTEDSKLTFHELRRHLVTATEKISRLRSAGSLLPARRDADTTAEQLIKKLGGEYVAPPSPEAEVTDPGKLAAMAHGEPLPEDSDNPNDPASLARGVGGF